MTRFLLLLLAFASPVRADSVSIVTDVAPVQSLVSAVSGTQVGAIFSAGTDPHHAALRPSHVRMLSEADVLVAIGPTFVPWLVERALAVNPDLDVMILGDPQLTGHDWTDPARAQDWLPRIAETLSAYVPESAEQFAENAQDESDKIDALITRIDALLAPIGQIEIVTEHAAYTQFADRFGLNIADSIADHDAHEPGASHLAHLQHEFEDGHVDCLVQDFGENHGAAEMLANDNDVQVVTVDPLGHQIDPGPEHYRLTVDALAQGFAGCAAK